MKYQRVLAMYWSATNRTKIAVNTVAKTISEEWGIPLERFDFTLPAAREQKVLIHKEDLVIFGTPTYAGRVPNLLLKYIGTVESNGAHVIPIVTFGNRAFDSSLIELRDLLTEDGMIPVAAAAFVGAHAFSQTLGAGRPTAEDVSEMTAFAKEAVQKLNEMTEPPAFLEVPGVDKENRKYYTPRRADGTAIDMRKVKPKTRDCCDNCGVCAKVCPMGSIDFQDVSQVPGICIKCCACVKKCHTGAKYFDDEAYLYHKQDLEEVYARPGKNYIQV